MTMRAQILVIDDDKKICDLLSKLLRKNGYIVFFAINTSEAREIINYVYFNAIIVDYMMPKENGIEFINWLHKNNINIPTLMLTAVDEIDNKISALSVGANDYLCKPFNSQELVLRLNNLLKIRYDFFGNSHNLIIYGDIVFNKVTGDLKISNSSISLSNLEAKIFEVFINNINEIIYKEDILKTIGKKYNESNIISLNVSIMRLRKKLESSKKIYIKTIRGRGFILTAE